MCGAGAQIVHAFGHTFGHTGPVKSGPVRKVWHLAARFFTSLSSAPPSDETEAWVAERLLPGEQGLWEQMSNQDRRHSALVGQRFAELDPTAPRELVAGALLHDVGKIECRLGTFGRVVATVVGPHGTRFRAYHDHEEIGAAMAAAAGSDPVTVELIAGRGPGFATLEACDHA
jgi:hypothetical protein